MTDRLLPITPEQLAGLPDHTPVLVRHDEHTLACCVLVTDAEGRVVLPIAGSDPDLDRLPSTCVLDLSDLVTRAVVAARIVRPWSDHILLGNPVSGLSDGPEVWYADVVDLVGLAERFADMTAGQIEALTRLARAALEAR